MGGLFHLCKASRMALKNIIYLTGEKNIIILPADLVLEELGW